MNILETQKSVAIREIGGNLYTIYTTSTQQSAQQSAQHLHNNLHNIYSTILFTIFNIRLFKKITYILFYLLYSRLREKQCATLHSQYGVNNYIFTPFYEPPLETQKSVAIRDIGNNLHYYLIPYYRRYVC